MSFGGRGGGLAYVARLLRVVCESWEGAEPWTAALEPSRYGAVSLSERARFAGRVAAAQVGGRVDWLAFNHVGIARVQRLVPRAVRRPYLVFVHDVEAWDPDIGDSRVATLREARLRVANSRYTARRVADAHPTIGAVVACPLGLLDSDPAADGVDTGPAGLPGDAPDGRCAAEQLARLTSHSALIVGRMHDDERYKGHDELLESWPSVVARVPDAQLVVVGLGNDMRRLQEKARTLGVGSHVLFCGFVPRPVLLDLLGRVGAFAMPSAREGFGLVYLEAMRAGLPCIGSTSDAAGDIIVHGETGLLVDRADRRGLADGVVALLSNAELRLRMGEAGRRRYETQFTAAHFAHRLGDILHETPMMDPR